MKIDATTTRNASLMFSTFLGAVAVLMLLLCTAGLRRQGELRLSSRA